MTTTAESEKFRRASRVEIFGDTLGRMLPASFVRPWLKAAYHALMNLKTGGKGIECTLPDGERVRIAPAFRYVSWNVDEYQAFKKALGPGRVALDVGANVGCYSILFAQWVGATGKVYAFEPAPQTIRGLRQHLRLNNLDSVVKTIQAAVSDQSETANFLLLEQNGMSRLAMREEQATQAQTISVPTVTIDEFCEREGIAPDLIKVDVEGFELAVLRGARETIKRRGKNLSLFVELHPTTWRELGLSKDDFVAELDAQGLEALPLGDCTDLWTVEGECVRLVAK